MSSRLPVLSDDNLCRECDPATSCCNPVPIGFGQKIPYPVPYNHPLQYWDAGDVLNVRIEIIRHINALLIAQKALLPSHFTGSNFALRTLPDPTDRRQPHFVATGRVAVVMTDIDYLAACTRYDLEKGVCTDYDNRPELCRTYNPDTCGRSIGSRVSRALILEYRTMLIAAARTNVIEAMRVYDAHLL
ncbi:YkgJ family cysteine cluster protein [Candidatus Peregrinibacteria bacterium]|nr:MAG: YkgJ family cysteine cluster protein [Candidatus Peregrinibacteria bacterium]